MYFLLAEPILIGPLFVQAVFEGVEFEILIIIGKFASPAEPRLASLKSVVPRVLTFVGVCQEYVQTCKVQTLELGGW